ncbi:MAG: choice-of-anchor W domain-containing protein [Phycisphaerales bacterium]|jgi:hypothetical protein|nr:hypothetical protein [Phycisphaeraceae bacterium]
MDSQFLCVAAVAAVSMVGSAMGATTVSPLAGGDAAFNALTNNGTLERAVVEARIGDSPAGGTWEQAIWKLGAVGQPQTSGQFAWTSGVLVPFTFAFDGASTVTFSLGSSTQTWNAVEGSFTDIFVCVRSTSNSSIALTQMSVSGLGAIADLTSSGAVPAAYLRISNTNAFGAVSISGQMELSWTGQRPNGSGLAAQIKFSNIPTPGAAAVLGLAGLVATRRRRA